MKCRRHEIISVCDTEGNQSFLVQLMPDDCVFYLAGLLDIFSSEEVPLLFYSPLFITALFLFILEYNQIVYNIF